MEKAYLALIKPKAAGGAPGGGSEIGRVTFIYNPKEFTYKKSASWDRKPAKGAKASAPPEFKGADPMAMTVEVFLDAYETGDDITQQIALLSSCCVPLEAAISGNKPTPPWVIFGWGKQVHITAYVKSVDVKCTMFDSDGTPLRATCTVTMEEIPPDVAKQNPTSGAVTTLRSHLVVAGDTLPSIAYEQYGQPGAWRVLAEANEIDDPLRLVTGRRVLVPDLGEALESTAG
jgi:nucleoid-associated protein YgaU